MAWTHWFDSRFSLRVHIVQCVLILAAVILTIVRIAMPAPFTTRAHMMALAMGIKSLIFIGYQLASAHTARGVLGHGHGAAVPSERSDMLGGVVRRELGNCSPGAGFVLHGDVDGGGFGAGT
ncbi:hypothetical protein S40285_10255 [Stachybotrys chlorohalonatus IBT 40285]|uniref:Uncharacterized protein n=1 Tax=Stachybotrys chlorohalonatus (strain IBT 40285) TaxID=1283841 RepID=A0A084QH10_STAC4|nr:hypothetical protein S40285_10255 [Stachybotrys chlorohalonata IBT 40285]